MAQNDDELRDEDELEDNQKKGEKAEKGDLRRPELKHSGPTRPHADRSSRSGSDSNAGSDD